ncbi:MAG TPA: efflux RND transporter periplasmic adaptor subunit [Kofleriaceae bacterium]|jgi:Cu(I)/Ag(I) efflux system membrane fusion protein|nr:efflux RND transporter periplasmic adaptor subunit [Kofleriaceae bacterium]
MSDTQDSSPSSASPGPAPVAAPKQRIDPHEPRRTRIVSVAAIGALIVTAIVFRKPLMAWFTGSSIGGSTSEAVHVSAGGVSIDAALDPDPPRESGNHAHIVVRDAQGKPVTGAKVRLEYDMPAMGAMQAMHGGGDTTEDGEGRYTVAFDLGMGGSWTITIRVTTPSVSAIARYTLRVGSAGLTPLGGESQGVAGATGSGSMGAMDMGSNPSDVSYYTCSMHPSVHSHEPGKCPICSMDLTPVTRQEEQAGVIHIEDSRRLLLGIRTTKALRAPIDLTITAKGRLAVDETRLYEITLKIGGYISDLRVNATGQSVNRGDTLFTLYSPELYAAEQEYLIARQNQDAMRVSGDTAHSERLVRAAETKLRLWGLSDDQLAALAKSGEPIERVPFRSPASGVVIEKNVVDGAAVTMGQRLFRIADLADIWVEADLYESDLPRITKGLPASITLDYLPGKTFDGKVAFIYPYLDPGSRTGRVRIALPNKAMELKPDMYATVMFKLPLGPRLVVPISAVVYTGPRRLVFVDLGNGALQPKEVMIGARSGNVVEITSGVNEGDTVVSSGNFLVAAESRVRSAGSFWEGSHDDQH